MYVRRPPYRRPVKRKCYLYKSTVSESCIKTFQEISTPTSDEFFAHFSFVKQNCNTYSLVSKLISTISSN